MNKVWLITGASSGFGRALAEAALGDGDVAGGAARRPEALDDLVAAHPDQMEALRLDVADTAAAGDTVGDVLARHGRIDVLVNNAGRTHVGALEETGEDELRALFDVHVFGPAALTRAVLPSMRERRSGAIVQMSSMGGAVLRRLLRARRRRPPTSTRTTSTTARATTSWWPTARSPPARLWAWPSHRRTTRAVAGARATAGETTPAWRCESGPSGEKVPA
ncbi:hypothetical protein STENM327S_01148 [Streptomyces tendae]